MKIRLNIDTRGYTEKPSKQAAAISNRTRCAKGQKDIEPAELIKLIEKGYTFTPAAIGGTLEEIQAKDERGKRLHRTSEYWQSQQIIIADIDNDLGIPESAMQWGAEIGRKKDDKKPNEIQLTPAAALKACHARGIDPYCIYKTFSYTPEHEKYRVLLVLSEPITDFAEASDYIGRFCQLFNDAIAEEYRARNLEPELCADTSIEPVKLIFGGRAGCTIYQSGKTTPNAILSTLPKSRENAPKTASNPEKGNHTNEKREAAKIERNAGIDIDADIASFDLQSYILATAGGEVVRDHINPCPMCKKRDCLHVSGAVWYCHSSNHTGINGGRIIDYLMRMHNLSTGEAFRMFKDEIMRYPAEAIQGANYEPMSAEELESLIASFEEMPKKIQDNPTPAGDPGKDPERTEAPASDPAEDPANMKSLEDNMPGYIPAPAKPHNIINAASYLMPKEGARSYDEDIRELMQYAGRKMGMHPGIDKYLTLYPGLAVLGGQASLGKTTFCVNAAMQLLERGEHVLYFTLEQLPDEIMTKAAARAIYEAGQECAVDNIMLNNGLRDEYINESLALLAEKLEHFNIIECDFETTAAAILETCEQYMRDNPGVKPIVMIDYLQIIAPPADFKGTKGECIDENLKALKKWQKNNGLFVLVISSFNRSNNILPVSYESFMLTSAIEYTCDYVFGLQLQILDPDNKEFYVKIGSYGGESEQKKFEQRRQVQEAQAQTPKKVQFVSLKNRKGKQFFKANFDYYPAHDYFAPHEKHTTPKAGKRA